MAMIPTDYVARFSCLPCRILARRVLIDLRVREQADWAGLDYYGIDGHSRPPAPLRAAAAAE